MKRKKVTVELPVSIYELLQEVADASDWTFQEVLVQSVKSGLPPSLAKVPKSFHDDLIVLNKLDDRDLMRLVEGEVPPNLDPGPDSADFKLLRQTYALRLLKWRGHPIPPPFESLVS